MVLSGRAFFRGAADKRGTGVREQQWSNAFAPSLQDKPQEVRAARQLRDLLARVGPQSTVDTHAFAVGTAYLFGLRQGG